MRKRRGRRFTWFPTFGTDYNVQNQPAVTTTEVFPIIEIGGVTGEVSNPITVPLLQDRDIEPDDPGSQITLRDRVEGKDYLLKRIVGKVWGGLSQDTNDAETVVVERVLLAAGIGVLPVNDEFGTPALEERDINPLFADNSVSPWMWRRTWTLYNNLATPNVDGGPLYTGPTNISNVAAGTFDAGHVDVKSARRVTREQRLYLTVAFQILETSDFGGAPQIGKPARIHFGYDFRFLGAMRTAMNRSTFK